MAEYNLTAANNYTSNNILSLDNNTSTNGLYTNVGSINFNIIGNSSLNNPNTALIRGNNTNNPPLLNNLPSPLSNKSSQNNRKTPTTTSNNQINLVNLQQQQQQQQQKNPNRNKKVKDLILDMRLQSQQQQQQQQIQEHQIYHQPMTNNHELSHHHMENNNHQHHQLPPPEMISDQFHFNTSSYFPKPNLNQPQTSNPPLHHHQLDLTPSQQSSNHLMELNLNSASYLNLDDSNTHPSKSITLNCLNSNSAANNNSNIDLIQLLNSTNTTIDDCNNLYNNNPSIQPQIQQNKTLIDLNNHHNNHHHQELIIPYHLHQQQLIQSHHNSTLSQTIHQPHHHLNGVTNGSHDPLCGGNDIDECHGINQHQHQHQHHEPDDNLLLYNILNKLSNQPSNPSNLAASNQLVNTDNSKQTTSSNPATASSVSSTSSLLLLSATNSDYNSSPPQQQQQPASSEKKLDSSEYISLMINQPQQAINTPPQPQNKSSTYATLQPASTDLDPKIQLLPAPKQEKFDNYTSSPQVENNRNEQYLNMNHVVENNTSQQILPAKKTEKSKVNSPNNNNNMMMMINTAANKHEEMTSSASSTSSSSPADNNNNNESNGYNSASHLNKPIASPTNAQMEELNTKELAHRISSELKRYSIPQAVFAQRVLCRSQGTLSDLLRNPKPWSKLKSGRETFRRMFKWLQEPEAQRMNSLRLAAATKRKEDGDTSSFTNPDDPNDENNNNTDGENAFDDEDVVVGSGGGGVGMVVAGGGVGVAVGPPMVDCDDDDDFMTSGEENQSTSSPRPLSSRKSLSILNDSQYQQQSSHSGVKKPRLVFTDIQRRTLQAIFKETKRPSKEMQMTIAQQLDLEVATVSNFFMNARRRSMDKWKDQDDDNSNSSGAK